MLPCLPAKSPTSLAAGSVAEADPLNGLKWPPVAVQLPFSGTSASWMWYGNGPPDEGKPLTSTETKTEPLLAGLNLIVPEISEVPLGLNVATTDSWLDESVCTGASPANARAINTICLNTDEIIVWSKRLKHDIYVYIS